MAAADTADQTGLDQASVWDSLAAALSGAEDRPRAAAGIEAAHQKTRSGAQYVVVRSPADTYLRLEPREFELLQLMDGTRTVKALVIADFQAHRVLSPPRVIHLVDELRRHRFLADPPTDAYALLAARLRPPPARLSLERLARGFVYSEFSCRGVDAFLGLWYRLWGRRFFTWAGAAAIALLALLGPILLVVQYAEGRYQLFGQGGSSPGRVLVFFALGMCVLMFHEMGHGFAVKHAGRRVRRAGFLIYYGFPAAFVDTTDIWMTPLPQRILCSLAGPLIDFALGGVCVVVAYLLPTGPLGAFLAAWGTVFLINECFNFNPLLELDGYYILVDLLDKPMLRSRAFAFLRGPLLARLRRRERLNAEERLFTLFGLASAIFSGLMLLFALRFWDHQLRGALVGAWMTGGLPARLFLGLLAAMAAALVARAAWARGRQLAANAPAVVAWAKGRLAAEMHHQAVASLRAVPFFADWPEPRLVDVASAMRPVQVGAGSLVVRQGDPGALFYVIASGRFDVWVDGRRVARLGKGDYFGERALLHDAPRAASVVAGEPGRLFSLRREAFLRLLAADLEIQERLAQAVSFRADVVAMPLFQGLSPAELDLLLAHLTPLRADAGQEVIRQGEAGDRFYIVRSGALEVTRDGEALGRLGPGDSFGEIALLLDVPRTATVRALEPSGLLALDARDFDDLLVGYLGRAGELRRMSDLRLTAQARREAPRAA